MRSPLSFHLAPPRPGQAVLVLPAGTAVGRAGPGRVGPGYGRAPAWDGIGWDVGQTGQTQAAEQTALTAAPTARVFRRAPMHPERRVRAYVQ